MQLSGKDRRYLRSLGNQLRATVWIGKEGLTPPVMRAIDDAHRGSELIKVKILELGDHDRKAIADAITKQSPSMLAGMVGGTILLYRRDKEKPRIVLPSSGASSA